MTTSQFLKIALVLDMDGPETVNHLLNPKSYPILDQLREKAQTEADILRDRLDSIPARPENLNAHLVASEMIEKLQKIVDSI